MSNVVDKKWQKRFEWLSTKIQEIHEEANNFNRHLKIEPVMEECISDSNNFYISNDLDGATDNREKAEELWGENFFHTVLVKE